MDMGWLYLIKNGDLYKIGITKNFDTRMQQLKPDKVLARIYSVNFKMLERDLHKRYSSVRIPQTEYFRLNDSEINEIKQIISNHYYPSNINSEIFIKVFILLLILFLFLILLISLTNNNINYVLMNSILWIEKISLVLSLFSFSISSNNYFSFINELKFRITRTCFFISFWLLFRFILYFFY